MGTRGASGFKVNGQLKVMYNHYDSYPDGLGTEVVSFVRSVVENKQVDQLIANAAKLILVDETSKPTDELIDKYTKFADQDVSTRRLDDWYVLLRDLQGDGILRKTLSGEVEHIMDGESFLRDSLFCEYAYIINLDDRTLEFYKGFQTTPQKDNPFGTTPDGGGYYPVALVARYPLDDIPKDWDTVYRSEE